MSQEKVHRILQCLTSVHQTLSLCGKCLDCCTEQEKEIYLDIAEDMMKHSKKLRKIDFQ